MNTTSDFSGLYDMIFVKNGLKLGRLNIVPGGATPAPPITPCLGQRGIPIPSFCKTFNDKTSEYDNKKLPLKVFFSLNKDKSLNLIIKGPSTTNLIMNYFNIKKGASNIGHDNVGNITQKDAMEIAKQVLQHGFMNTSNLNSIANNVISVAKSIGMKFAIN